MTTTSIILMFFASIVLVKAPIVGKYVRVLNTMIHESGHAIMALLTSGKVKSISLHMNTEGVATTGSRNWFGRVMTSIAGYPFASTVGFLFSFLFATGKQEWIIYILLGFIAVNLLLWVRNFYGFVWLLSFGGLIVASLFFLPPMTTKYVTLLLTFIIVVESVSTSFVILKLSATQPKDAGDATNLKHATFIPSVVWGLFFFLQSLVFLYFSYEVFIKNNLIGF